MTINSFFYESFMKLYDDIKPYLMDPTRKYIITGHSLGGAMASILAIKGVSETNIWKNDESSLITFGQPRTGDHRYSRQHDSLIDSFRKLRFVCSHDPIPQLKISFFTSDHHSREVWMATQFWWGSKRYWKVCPSRDTRECSKQIRFLPNINDHMMDEYDSRVMNLPTVYEDKKRNEYSTWHSALRNTCK